MCKVILKRKNQFNKYALFYNLSHLFVTFVSIKAFLSGFIKKFFSNYKFDFAYVEFYNLDKIQRGGMDMLKKEEMPACPVATTVQLIGSKWKTLILRNLMERPWRFNELKKDLEGVSQKVLTDSLRSMEEDGIVVRTIYPEVPPRVEYSLSELGETMRPIIKAMEQWGNYYKSLNEDK